MTSEPVTSTLKTNGSFGSTCSSKSKKKRNDTSTVTRLVRTFATEKTRFLQMIQTCNKVFELHGRFDNKTGSGTKVWTMIVPSFEASDTPNGGDIPLSPVGRRQ